MSRRNYAKGMVLDSRSNDKLRRKKRGQTTIFGLGAPIQTPVLNHLEDVGRLDLGPG